jgi:hypothetical protein
LNRTFNGFGDPDPTSVRILLRYSVSAAVGIVGLGDLLRWTLRKQEALVGLLVLDVVFDNEVLAKGSETWISGGESSVLEVNEEKADADGQLVVLFVVLVTTSSSNVPMRSMDRLILSRYVKAGVRGRVAHVGWRELVSFDVVS